MRNVQYKSDRKVLGLSRKHKHALIRPTVQELWSMKFGGAAELSSGQTAVFRAIWTLGQMQNETWDTSKPNL